MSRELFGLLLLFVQASINIPIIIKLLKVKTGKGISLTGETVWIAGGVGWIIYGYMTDSVTLMISGSLAAIGCAIVSILLWKYSRPKLAMPLGLGIFTFTAIVLSGIFGGVIGLSISLSIFGVLQFLPQLSLTINDIKTRAIPAGVSVTGTTFRAFYTGGWAVYAGAWILWSITVAEIDWPLLVWGLAGVVTFGTQAAYTNFAMKRLTPATGSIPVQSL